MGAEPAPALAPRALVADGIRAPRTRLFGRAAELAALDAWAHGGDRLATLTGGGGVGKTRLATELALRRRASGAVLFVELGAAGTAREALTTLARALGADVSGRRDEAALATALGAALAALGPALLVLDEVDRVVGALGAPLARLLEVAAEARVLVTSRERVGLPGERVITVAPLEAGGEADAALALFLDRAERGGADVAYDDHETGALRELLRRLDGLPLAIEIAAARSDVLPPSRLLELLAHRFEVLATTARGREGRHASMHAAVAFSWELLPPEARAALARLAYLTGPFELAAARAVMGLTDADASAMLELLARRSLVVHRGPTEHALLETIRDFARAAAAPLGVEADAVARRDAWFVERAERLAAASRGWSGAKALAELGSLREQLQAIVSEALAGGPASIEAGLRSGLALAHYVRRACLPPWGLAELPVLCERSPEHGAAALGGAPGLPRPLVLRGLLALARLESDAGRRDARDTLARARALVTPDVPDAARWLGEIAVGEGRDAFDQSHFEEARDKAAEAIAHADQAGPIAAEVRAMALTNLTSANVRLGKTDDVLANLERARELFIEAGALDRVPLHLAITFFNASQLGQGERGRAALVEGLRIAREVGTPRDETALEAYLGVHDLDNGGLAGARDHLTTAYSRGRTGFERMAGQCAVMLAHVALEAGDHAAFARWRAAARAQLAPFGAPIELSFLEAQEAARRAMAGDLAGAHEQLARLDPAALAHADSVAAAADGLGAIVHLADALAAARAGDSAGADAHLAAAERLRARLVGAAAHGDDPRRVLSLVERALAAARGDRPVLCLSIDGLAVRVVAPGGSRPWEDLARKPTLQRLLRALVAHRLDHPGELLDADALGAAGWPGERMLEEARDNRLYVTLSKLRALGLDDALEHLAGGWRIRRDLGVLWLDPVAWPAPTPATPPAPTTTPATPPALATAPTTTPPPKRARRR